MVWYAGGTWMWSADAASRVQEVWEKSSEGGALPVGTLTVPLVTRTS